MAKRRRRHTRAFKLAAIARMETTEDVEALARELGLNRGLLYKWGRQYRRGGEAALRLPGERSVGEPRDGDHEPTGPELGPGGRTVELERKVAQQALELDFFRAALRHFEARRPKGDGSGGTDSTP